MRIDQIIDRLLEHGDPSIQYRIKREILGISSDDLGMQELQTQIARKKKVTEVVGWTPEPANGNGWIGTELHGVTGTDCGVQILLERGLETTHPYLSGVRDALIERGDNYEDIPPGYSVLLEIDRAGRGGLRTMRAWLLGLLEAEDEPIVREETTSAFSHFNGLCQLKSLDEISTVYNGSKRNYAGCRVYKPQVKFPGGWHLPLLAATKQWQSEESYSLLADAFNNAVNLFPIPPLILKKGNHYVGPGNVRWHSLQWEDITQMPELEFSFWLGDIEMLGRVKVLSKVAYFRDQVDQLRDLIEDEEWVAGFKPHYAFKYMYGLEEDWRSKRRKENDVYFRFLITLFYCDALGDII